MQPGRQFNQPQTFGVYFPQSTPQQQFQPALGPPQYQGYGSPGPTFYSGQPLVPVTQRYQPQPPPMVPPQNYGGPQFIGAPPVKPFPEHQQHQFNPQFPPHSQGVPPHQGVPLPAPATPPQSQVLFPSPGHQAPPGQYAWSTTVTPPSPYYNNDRVSPIQQCQVPLPPRLKLLGQYLAQGDNAAIEVDNKEISNFNPDPALLRVSPPPFSSDKDIFKHKASQLGINIESPPEPEKIDNKTVIINNNEIHNNDNNLKQFSDNTEGEVAKTDSDAVKIDVVNLKPGKRRRDEDNETRSPITLPSKTAAQRNGNNKQKVSANWSENVSLNNIIKLPDNSRYAAISKALAEDVSVDKVNGLPEGSIYSSFPDSSVDIGKVLAENAAKSDICSKEVEEVFDDSVDYIEEHEFLAYDVTSSPFSPYDTDEEHEENGCLETRSHDEIPESPVPEVKYSIVNIKPDLTNEIEENDGISSNDERVLMKFRRDLEESEIKTNEIIKSGVVNDTNIEMLASAIVTGVLAKAVIEVVSQGSGDKHVKRGIKVLDIESSVDGNLNTNAEVVTVKPDPEIIREMLNDVRGVNDKANGNEVKGTNEKGDESEGNINEIDENESPTSERHRLYSWPYSEDKDNEMNNEIENPKETVIEVTTPSKAHKVEIIVDKTSNSDKENITADSIAKTVKTVSESSKDFEKYYFKQKASQHGIEIISPLRNLNSLNNLKETASMSSESDNENDNLAKMRKGRLNSMDRNSRSVSESSDYQSVDSDSQSDPAYIFKQKASKLGITFQNPNKTIELSTENSDAEVENYASKHKDLHLVDPRRSRTSTPEPGLILNPDSPEFKPGWRKKIEANNSAFTKIGAVESNSGSLNTSSSDISESVGKIELRVDAPEFNPANFSMKTASQKLESWKNVDNNQNKGAKIFHIPTPKAKVENPSIGIQASPNLTDISVNTRRVKTKDFGGGTNSCDNREVCVNTDAPGVVDQGESYTLPVKPAKHFVSKNTNTDVPKRRSIAVSVNMTGNSSEKKKEYESKIEKLEAEKAVMSEQIKYLQSCKVNERGHGVVTEQVKALQIEVMRHRANLHMNRIFLMQHKIHKEMTALIESLAFSNDRRAQDTIHNIAEAKLNMLAKTTRKINDFLEEMIGKIQAGIQYPTLPDFTFFSDDPEQNRVIANEQLFELATGSPQANSQQSNQPIKIDFSPTNRNIIEFTATAEPKGEDVRTPEHPKRTPVSANKLKQSPAGKSLAGKSPAAKQSKLVAAAFSPQSANKPVCLFVNKADIAEQEKDGVHDNVEEEEEEKLPDFEDVSDTATNLEKDKHSGRLNDLDLDSDDEITEVSTALTDYGDLGLDEGAAGVKLGSKYDEDLSLEGIDGGKSGAEYGKVTEDLKDLISSKLGAEYGPQDGDLKDLISSKMNEVYGDISEYNTCESSANESSLAETSVLDKSKEIGEAIEIVSDDVETVRKETNVCAADSANEKTANEENPGKAAKAIELSDQVNELVQGKELENIDEEKNEMKSSEVPENWESLELDKDEIFMSPEAQIESPVESENKVENIPDNPFNEGLGHSASAEKYSADVQKNESETVVPQIEQGFKMSVENVNESKVKAVAKSLEPVSASLPTSLATTIPSSTSGLQANSMNSALTTASSVNNLQASSMNNLPASSMNNPISSAMSMIQPVGANIMVPPPNMLMNSINPMLYQMVVAQLIKAYPTLAANPDMLSNVALQQASLLQHYIATGQISAANINETFLQGAGDGAAMLGNMDPTGLAQEMGAESGAAGVGLGTQMPAMTNGVVDSSNKGACKTKDNTVKDNNSIKGATNQTHANVDTSKEVGAVVNSDSSLKSDTNTAPQPVPYRPPGLRALVSSPSETMFQSTVTNKTSNSISTMSQNPFSAVKSQPVKPTASVTSTSSARPNPPNPNANNSALGFSDLSKPLRRPFKQYTPVSKPSSINQSDNTSCNINQSNVNTKKSQHNKLKGLMDDYIKSNDNSQPKNVVNKTSDNVSQGKDIVYDTIPNSASSSGLDDFDAPPRPPSRSERKPLPVSFSSVPEIKPVVSSHSLPMQASKSANVNQNFGDSKAPLPQSCATAAKPKHADFLPQYAKRHAPELRDKAEEVPSRDFLPSFVKSIPTADHNLTENQQSFQDHMPPRFRRASAPQRQSSTEEENWDDEIDPYAETKQMKINPKRELHMRSLSSRKPTPNEALWQSSAVNQRKNSDADSTNPGLWQSSGAAISQRKNSDADLTNPLFGRASTPSTPSPSFEEGTSGLSDIPLPKKLRTSEEKTEKGEDGEKEEQEWCEVTTKKKKQKELKKFSAPSSSLLPSYTTQAEKDKKKSNFERLIEKILEKYPNAERGEAINSFTRLREQRGGTLKGLVLEDIVAQAGHILEVQMRQGKTGQTNQPKLIPGLWTNSSRQTPPKLNLSSFNSPPGHHEDEEICVICHDPLTSLETKALDCGHVFHSDCIGRWVYGRERTCPTCRQHALFPEEFPALGK